MTTADLSPYPEPEGESEEDADWRLWAEQMTARGPEFTEVRYVMRLNQAWAIAA